jgi:hypothetical protein
MSADDHLHPQLFSGFGRPVNRPAAVEREQQPWGRDVSIGPPKPRSETPMPNARLGPTEQLPMFMSAREIKEQYQPLDADRYGATGTNARTTRSSGGGEYATARTWQEHHTRRTTGGSKLYLAGEGIESDEQLWERKAEEADDYGLANDIREEGVQKPVSLGRQFGEMGKPQVVGGHHRIAVMGEEAPDELMPVLHYESFHHARMQGQHAEKGRGGYRYT